MQLKYEQTFSPKYSGKLFKVTPGKNAYTIESKADPHTPEGKALQKLVDALWEKEMKSFKKEKEKLYSGVFKITERNIYKTLAKRAEKEKNPKKLQRWLEEEVKGANVMIQNAMKTHDSVVKKRAQELYSKASTAVDKKYKTKLRKMKVKATLRILGHVSLVLVAGALGAAAIVAGVVITGVTAGVGAISFAVIAPAAFGLFVKGYKSSVKVYSIVKKEWPNCEKSVNQLLKATEDLEKALDYAKKKREKKDITGKLNPKERLKLYLNDIKGNIKTVKVAMKNCEVFAGSTRQAIERLAKEVMELERNLEKLEKAAKNEPKLQKKCATTIKKMADLLYKIKKNRDTLAKFNKTIAEGRKIVNSADVTEPGKLRAFILKIQKFTKDSTVKALVGEFSDVASGAKELVTAGD